MRSIVESIRALKFALEDSVAALREKEVEDVPDQLKLSEIAGWIDKVGGETPVPELPSVACDSLLNLKIGIDGTVEHVVFTDSKCTGTPVNFGTGGTADVVKWLDGTTLYVSTQNRGAKVLAPADCKTVFKSDTTLVSVDFTGADLTAVTAMDEMFSGCSNLETVTFGNKCPSLYTMGSVFLNCEKLTSVNLDGFDWTRTWQLSSAFNGCKALTTLSFGASEFTSLSSMYRPFANMNALTSIDLSNFNTTKVTNMSGAFLNCSQLETLDLSTFEIGAVTDMTTMFSGCSKLKTLYASEWDSTKNEALNSSGMFNGCSALPNYADGGDITKAKWKENGGYFTNPSEKG